MHTFHLLPLLWPLKKPNFQSTRLDSVAIYFTLLLQSILLLWLHVVVLHVTGDRKVGTNNAVRGTR